MNLAHLHLLINHLPIAGTILGGFVLAYALYTKNTQTKTAAYYLLLFSTIGAIIAYLTGDSAEESVEHLQGVTKGMIDQHEDLATIALVAICITGFLSLIGLYMVFMKNSLSRKLAKFVLFLSLVSFGLIAATGYYGGLIRHSELSTGAAAPSANGDKEAADHDGD